MLCTAAQQKRKGTEGSGDVSGIECARVTNHLHIHIVQGGGTGRTGGRRRREEERGRSGSTCISLLLINTNHSPANNHSPAKKSLRIWWKQEPFCLENTKLVRVPFFIFNIKYIKTWYDDKFIHEPKIFKLNKIDEIPLLKFWLLFSNSFHLFLEKWCFGERLS